MRRTHDRTTDSSSARSRGAGAPIGPPAPSFPSAADQRAARELETLAARAGHYEPARRQPPVGAHARQDVRQRPHAVARERRLFEPFLRRELVHTRLEAPEEPARRAKRGQQLVDHGAVALRIGAAVARGLAPAHVGEGTRGEPGAPPHRARASPDAEGLFQGLFREGRAPRGCERTEVDRSVARVDRPGDLESGPRLERVQFHVGESAPSFSVGVEPRQVLGDQPDLQHERLQLPAGGEGLDPRHGGHQVLHFLAFIAVEIGLHARAQIVRLADVEDLVRAVPEDVDAGRSRELLRERDLGVVRPPARAARVRQLAKRLDAEVLADVEQALEDLAGRLRVVQRAVGGFRARAEVRRERLELDVRNVGPDQTAGQLRGADRGRREDVVVEAQQVAR